MKIALLCDRYPPRPHSGIGTFVQMLAHALHQRGHRVLVVDIAGLPGQHSDCGIPIVTFPRTRLRYLGNLITRLRLRSWLLARVHAGLIDLIEVPDYPGFLPFSIPGCATVVRLHQSSTVSHLLAGIRSSPAISFYEKRTLAAHRNWIAVSNRILGLTESVFSLSPRKSAVIHNGVAPLPPCAPNLPPLPARFVLYGGQVSRRKGCLVLAEAAREFLPRHPDVHLVYAGGCLPEPGVPIDRRIRGVLGGELALRVHFLGQLTREQILACMRRATVFVFPALIDCFPLVVLEAMSAGLPVVFTRNPPGPEMIEDGITGLLADPASPLDFAAKTSRLLDHPELASALARRATECVAQQFSLDQCVRATERFYEECLAEVRGRTPLRCSSTGTFPLAVPPPG